MAIMMHERYNLIVGNTHNEEQERQAIVQMMMGYDEGLEVLAMEQELLNAPNRFECLLQQTKEHTCVFNEQNIKHWTGENYELLIEAIGRANEVKDHEANDGEFHHDGMIMDYFSNGWAYEHPLITSRITRLLLWLFDVNVTQHPEALRLIECVVASKAGITAMDVVYARLTGMYVFEHMETEAHNVEIAGENLVMFRLFQQDDEQFRNGNLDVVEIPLFALPMAILQEPNSPTSVIRRLNPPQHRRIRRRLN